MSRLWVRAAAARTGRSRVGLNRWPTQTRPHRPGYTPSPDCDHVPSIGSESGLSKVYDWLCVNKLSLNVSKSRCLVFNNPKYPTVSKPYELEINNEKIKSAI